MDGIVIFLIAGNAVVGLSLAFPVGRLLLGAEGADGRRRRGIATAAGMYAAECVALAVGMTVPIANVVLALGWGRMLGMRPARAGCPRRRALRTAAAIGAYTSAPAVLLLAVPVAVIAAGGDALSPEAGAAFGIPDVPGVPWPLETVMGFYIGLALGTLALKVAITVGMVRLRLRLRPSAGAGAGVVVAPESPS